MSLAYKSIIYKVHEAYVERQFVISSRIFRKNLKTLAIVANMPKLFKGCFMRAVLQRVDRAGVNINSRLFSSISQGLLVLLGVEKGDSRKDADYVLEKTVNLRIFEDEQGKMNRSLADIGGEMMVVSQFTLLADCVKGRRPSFAGAEEPEKANELYEYFVSEASMKVKKLATGRFQEMMQIELINNGPVTILLDSRKTV